MVPASREKGYDEHWLLGVLQDALQAAPTRGRPAAFYGMGTGEFRHPVLMSQAAVWSAFGSEAKRASLLLRTAPDTDLTALAGQLQGTYLQNGLVVSNIGDEVEAAFASSNQFFRLMQGYLGLGLLVGIAGLSVVMVRAVRERRRTIGVLRALGFRAQTVQRAFMAEATLVAVEGVITGAVLGFAHNMIDVSEQRGVQRARYGFPHRLGVDSRHGWGCARGVIDRDHPAGTARGPDQASRGSPPNGLRT